MESFDCASTLCCLCYRERDSSAEERSTAKTKTLADFSADSLEGELVPLSKYLGKVCTNRSFFAPASYPRGSLIRSLLLNSVCASLGLRADGAHLCVGGHVDRMGELTVRMQPLRTRRVRHSWPDNAVCDTQGWGLTLTQRQRRRGWRLDLPDLRIETRSELLSCFSGSEGPPAMTRTAGGELL